MSAASVIGEIDRDKFRAGGAVVDSGDRSKRVGTVKTAQHADLQLVLLGRLLDVEPELQSAHVAVEIRHGVDASLVEQETVIAAVGVGGTKVDHRLVFVGHADILVRQCPAWRLGHCFSGSGGGVGVEIVSVGQVRDGDVAGIGRTQRECDVVDVVAAVVAGLAGGEDVLEGDVVAGACVGGEVDGSQYRSGTRVVEGCDSHERIRVG